MQQMSPEGAQAKPAGSYGAYESSEQYHERDSYTSGQKLHVDEDEQLADMLAKRIKQEIKDEVRTGKDETIGYRLALAIVSIAILVPLFVTLVVALSLRLGEGGTGIALAWGFVGICFVIFVVNAYFNWASTVLKK